MSDSSARNLRSVIEAAGAGAVLLGLIFVGLELKQNTAAMQAATVQGLYDSSQEHMLLLASNPELLEIQLNGATNPDQLSDTEALQYFFLMRVRWVRYQNAFLQYQRGTMGEEDWETYKGLICRRARPAWPVHKHAMSSQFVEFVEECRSNP